LGPVGAKKKGTTDKQDLLQAKNIVTWPCASFYFNFTIDFHKNPSKS